MKRSQSSGEPINDALEARLRANPDEDRSVYGDWLEQQGHPRGELIALHNAGREDEAESFLRQHREQLLPFSSGDGIELDWSRGFLSAVALWYPADSHLIEKLVGHPSARILRELDIGTSDVADVKLADVLAMLAKTTWPLRILRINDDDGTTPIEAELCTQFPTLEELAISTKSGRSIVMTTLGPSLQKLVLSTLATETAAALCVAPLPALKDLELGVDKDTLHTLAAFFLRTDLVLESVTINGVDPDVVRTVASDCAFAERIST